MSGILISNRYARALYRSVKGNPEKIKNYREALECIDELFQIPKFRKILVSPVTPKDLKSQVLNYAIDCANGDEHLRSFIAAIVEAGRVEVFELILSAFNALINEQEGVVDATVTSVIPLPEGEISGIAKSLGQTLHKKINLKQNIDKSILGGFVVRIGNQLLDLSLRSKINALTQNAAR